MTSVRSDTMRIGILLIVALIGTMLIVGIVSSGKPIIKGVSKHSEYDGEIPITVSATNDNEGQIDVKVNDHVLTHTGEDIWEGKISPDEEIDDLTIEAHDNRDTGEKQIYGHGGCPSRISYDSHPYTYAYAHVDLQQDPDFKTTFSLHTEVNPQSGTGVIGICAYPEPGYDPDEGALLKLIYNPDLWEIKHNNNWDYFGFGRHRGLNLIPLNSVSDILTGSADYKRSTNSEKILMHILDPVECARDANEQIIDKDKDYPQNTCWRRAADVTTIPEFPTIALPIAAALVIMFVSYRRKKAD